MFRRDHIWRISLLLQSGGFSMVECVNSYANVYYEIRMQNWTPIGKCNGGLFTFVDWLKADRNPV